VSGAQERTPSQSEILQGIDANHCATLSTGCVDTKTYPHKNSFASFGPARENKSKIRQREEAEEEWIARIR
jgi:hypothetical protein